MSARYALNRKIAPSARIARLSRISSTRLLALLLVAILGVIVQIQITPEFGDTKIRINLADLIVAIVMPLVLYATLRNWSDVKQKLGWQVLSLFACATLVFSYAYVIGYWKTGFFGWAAVKYVGWYALMAYFAVGVFCTALLGKTGQKTFVLAFCWACGFLVLIQILYLYFATIDYYFSLTRIEGFTGNPNAFGFILICCFVLSITYKETFGSNFFKGSAELFCAVILAGIYFTGSISALLTLVLVLGLLSISIASWKQLFLILTGALVIVFIPNVLGVITPQFSTAVLRNKILSNLSGTSESNIDSIYHQTIGVRIDAIWQGIELWLQSPVFGAGLGVHLFQQQNNVVEGQPVVLIHNTGMWLLAGTGLVGLSVFVLLFAALAKKMWCNAKGTAKRILPLQSGNFASAALICMVAWLFMSLFHELMYQRLIWLIAGMALWPVANKQKP